MTNTASNRLIWRNGNFIRLWSGTVLSALGDTAIFILLPWYVIDVTGSEGALGTALLCMSLPRLLFMLAGGVVADRVNRRTILSLSVLARAAVLIGFSLLLTGGEGQEMLGAVYAMAVLFGVVDAFFWPARGSIMPFVVPKEQLGTANSVMETSQQLSMVGGPLLASFLLYLGSYPLMFAAVAVAFLLSLCFILTIRLVTNPSPDDGTFPNTPAKESAVRDLSDGIRYVLGIRVLAIIMVISLFLNMMFAGPINIGLPVLVKQLGWDGTALGYLQGTLGIGAILGGMITGLAKGFRGRFLLLPLFIGLLGTGVGALGFMTNLPIGLTMMLIAGAMLSMTNIPLITYIQTIVAPHMLGRVMSLLTLMSLGFTPVSFACTSFFLEHHLATPSQILLVGGICMSLLGLSLILFREFRLMEEHPSWRQHSAAS
ncbi:MFS transporter [Brevibacillus sp. H7]|uniref:MFS transporter n=1 Tax=Brevibacillus sp. H7 TaxID=3349138 RepID=UPI00381904A2